MKIIKEKLQEITVDYSVLKKYLLLIEKYIENPPEDNYEKHHILPKSLFPEYKNLSKNKWNCVKLPYLEHIEAHRLLSILTDNTSMKISYFMMSNRIDFEKLTEEQKQEIIESKNRFRENNITVIDNNGKYLKTTKDDPRFLTGGIKKYSSNRLPVYDKNNNIISINRDDPRYLSGELVSVFCGKISTKDVYGVYHVVDKNDPRYLSGEFAEVIWKKKET